MINVKVEQAASGRTIAVEGDYVALRQLYYSLADILIEASESARFEDQDSEGALFLVVRGVQ